MNLAGRIALAVVIGVLAWATGARAEQRFPPPEFESDYQMPAMTTPPPRALVWQYIDVGVLAVALGVAVWLVHRKRSRTGVLVLSVLSLIYFGFYRTGCICPIGAPQNVLFGLLNPNYAVPWPVVGLFVLPVVVALFAGRAFCAGVCPHGALQDLVLLKPVQVPLWLERGLSLVPFLFLGAGLAFAATGSIFLICKLDPFVPLFRRHGPTWSLLLGAAFLLVGTVVGRPFCRFICPYGALLRLAAMVTKWRVRVTPDLCTQCKLCEQSCPFGALRQPSSGTPDPRTLPVERRRLLALLLLWPALIAVGAWIGAHLTVPASRLHPTVRLAEFYLEHKKHPKQYPIQSPEALSLLRAEQTWPELQAAALQLRHRIELSMKLFGGWAGLVVGAGLIGLAVRRSRTDYEPDSGACLACARCFESCPQELLRRGVPIPLPTAASAAQPQSVVANLPTAAQTTNR